MSGSGGAPTYTVKCRCEKLGAGPYECDGMNCFVTLIMRVAEGPDVYDDHECRTETCPNPCEKEILVLADIPYSMGTHCDCPLPPIK